MVGSLGLATIGFTAAGILITKGVRTGAGACTTMGVEAGAGIGTFVVMGMGIGQYVSL